MSDIYSQKLRFTALLIRPHKTKFPTIYPTILPSQMTILNTAIPIMFKKILVLNLLKLKSIGTLGYYNFDGVLFISN